jgi:streptogramin lyase
MWFSEHAGNRIGRITPDGAITEFEIPTPDSQPRAIALAADGNIWFGMFAAGKIGRITPDGSITEFEIPTPDSGPRALAAGPDGNVWFSQFRASKIGRITPDGEIAEFPLPRPNSGPGDITVGTDGNLWFVELAGSMDGVEPDGNRVGRITPAGDIAEFPLPSAGRTRRQRLVHERGRAWPGHPDRRDRRVPDRERCSTGGRPVRRQRSAAAGPPDGPALVHGSGQ